MALSRSIPLFAHQRIARLIVNEDMEIDALEITKSQPDCAKHITGVVPQIGEKRFDSRCCY